jgi:hypothetical protein
MRRLDRLAFDVVGQRFVKLPPIQVDLKLDGLHVSLGEQLLDDARDGIGEGDKL